MLQNNLNQAKVKMQIIMNKRMYENGKISYATYSRANEILISRLTSHNDCDIITLSKKA